MHHLTSLIPNRINAAVNRLREAIWEDGQGLEVEATRAGPEQMPLSKAGELPRRKVQPGTYWGKLFDQRWCRVALPQDAGGRWLNWRDQGEATLYVDGKAWFGFDVGHRFCRLPKRVSEVWVESNCVQSAIWHPEATGLRGQGSCYEGATLYRRNDDAWEAYHDLKCLLDVALDLRVRENPQLSAQLNASGLQPPVLNHSPLFRRMLRLMDEAVDALDREGIPSLRKALSGAYAELRVDKTFARCVLTGHAHVDLVWIWPERIGELKAVHVFATVNRLMEEYPEFRFAYSQPASYEAVMRRDSELMARTRTRLRSGQWQATGAMYVESDTLLACGEALGRSLVVGQACFRELAGGPSRLLWLPDVFGYAACLPQLMKLTGVDYFFTTKMTWNALNRFPLSSFIWRGPDGSEVLAHVSQESGYVTHMQVPEIKSAMNGHCQADIHHEFLLPTGYGDGGGGPTDEMCERARRLGSLAGMPEIVWDQPEAFFERLEPLRSELPVHQGECYLEYHRGTYTTHGDLKAAFRGLERALQYAEAVDWALGQAPDRSHTWKRLIFAQFHDYIPGSSIWDVYQEGIPELKALATELEGGAAKSLSGGRVAEDCLFNPHAVPLECWVQPEGGAGAVRVVLPPLSGHAWREAQVAEQPEPVKLGKKRASNGLVDFEINRQGWITHLHWEGKSVPLKDALGKLILYVDRPANFESWDIDRQALDLGQVADGRATVESVSEGKHRGGFRVTRQLGQCSQATVSFMLEAGSPLLHVTVDLDWQETETLLKLEIPTDYAGSHARFGAPLGSVLRPQVPDGPRMEAMWEVPFSRWLAVSDDGEREGLFMVTEAKYGASVREGVVGLSLVRSPRVTGMEGHGAAWPAHLSRLRDKPVHSDQGLHRIALALGRYDLAHPRERQPASVAETGFTPPLAYRGAGTPLILEALEGGETLVPQWAVPLATGGYLLRLHEVAGQRGRLAVRTAAGWRVRQSDYEGGPSEVAGDGKDFPFRPYEIVTLCFERS